MAMFQLSTRPSPLPSAAISSDRYAEACEADRLRAGAFGPQGRRCLGDSHGVYARSRARDTAVRPGGRDHRPHDRPAVDPYLPERNTVSVVRPPKEAL